MARQGVHSEERPAMITGYVEPWIASPGESVDAKISSTESNLMYHVVRLIHGPQGTDFSNMKQEIVSDIPPGTFSGRYQVAHPGSYAIIDKRDYNVQPAGLDVSVFFQSYLLKTTHVQTILSTLDVATKTGFAVVLSLRGFVEFWVGNSKTIDIVSTNFQPVLKRWIKVVLNFRGTTVEYEFQPKATFTEPVEPSIKGSVGLSREADLSSPFTVLLAASFATNPKEASDIPTNFFNGRLDCPAMITHDSQVVLAKWDFSLGISSDDIFDVSGNGADGRLVNAPTRAVTGHNWDATESDWTKAKHGYGAIHFHEDDIDDAGWDTDFSFMLPETLRSGAYAVVVEAADGKATDVVPFYVRPTATTTALLGAKVAYIMPTFTYLAYANEHVYDRTHLMSVGYDWEVRRDEHALKTEARNDLGLSCYDVHNDRSGVIHSTAKRPILNMRPDYISWNFHRPRGLSADLIGLEFLERSGVPYDVVCDHDLHSFGKATLSQYGTAVTGSHPEYHTVESLCAITEYIKDGGNLMYLGGNGFYWSCATQSSNIHRLEIRRGDQGCRAFTQPGGDRIFSTNGQQGLLWRSRGLASNYFLGVGCCACGSGPGVPYKRTEVSKHPDLAWMFEGIGEGELIGEHGFGGGASGDEIDKCDLALGSPSNTIIVATSVGHPDEFCMFPEDAEFPMLKTVGTQTNEIRSDITYYETVGGGAVFSVGSINWFCSLGWNSFNNNVAVLTGNVLREFVSRKS